MEGVKAALQSGADVNTEDEFGEIGLMGAVIYNHNSVVALLLNTPNIDVNQKDNQGRCALHWAVTWENIEALKLLLNAPNIDVNIVTNNGKSALHCAVYSNSIEGLKLLLSHPSLTALTLNQKDKHYGETPAMLATRMERCSSRQVVIKLLTADPRIDLDTTDGAGRSLTYWEWEILNKW